MAFLPVKRPSSSIDVPQQKKARLFASQDNEDQAQVGAKVDSTYGQRGAFPGLDEAGEDELFYGPADDGMAYVRMVRQEARQVPNLLVAPKPVDSTDGTVEKDLYAPYEAADGGWYSDGAYTAAPIAEAAQDVDDEEELDPQEAYYIALLDRFDDLRSMLSSPSYASAEPLEAAVRSLPLDPTSRHWKHALLKSKPTPVLLNRLPQESVILGVEELEALFTTRNLEGGVRHKLGAWAWGLLGRCRDVSEMNSEEVSVVRGLGKKACALSRSLQAGNFATNDNEEDAETGHGTEVDVATAKAPIAEEASAQQDADAEKSTGANATLEDARKNLLMVLGSDEVESGLKSNREEVNQEPDKSHVLQQVSEIHATLDMIITIVGECYGQRDLLNSRLAWEEL